MEPSKEILDRLQKLEDKFAASGQDILSYLDGLMYADFLTYWDYINLDVLLNLQQPRTPFPDEKIFIIYHQITELYFNLILHEQSQIVEHPALEIDFFIARLKRVNDYFESLIQSFSIMVTGMDKAQFLKYRMALLPASGFQSVQYRKIEIYSTDFYQLVDKELRSDDMEEWPIYKLFENIYWKRGATEMKSGQKTLTLRQFEGKYSTELIELGERRKSNNFRTLYNLFPESDNKQLLKVELQKFDTNVNINWPLVHYKSAVKYLQKSPEDIAATGGTNWQKYLPPRFQKRIFYPEIWTTEEVENWGKAWVSDNVK